ncbi:MAG: S8 family serine peptidase [Epsilonproteobacteria bacterium]|nr:S8 family serine peptidase [Campylobacterota bacterium]
MNQKLMFSMVAASLVFSNLFAKDTIKNFAVSTINNINMVVPKPSQKYAPSEVIILLKEGADSNRFIKFFSSAVGDKNFSHQALPNLNTIHIKVPSMQMDMIKKMIEINPVLNSMVEKIEPNYINIPYATCNDPYFDKLWAIKNVAQEVNGKRGVKDADMDIEEAWQISEGSKDVVVAILDTGVDYTHEDLVDNMWSGNSCSGYDFAGDNEGNNDEDPMPDAPFDQNGHYHGTHIAGVIGAVGDNGVGVTGVAKKAQLMAVKVFRPNGYGYNSDILEGLNYILEQKKKGVNIVAVNASYGSAGGSSGDIMERTIKKLGDAGIVFCTAAGNEGKDIDKEPVYPASYKASNIISVAATNQQDRLASFSNYGKNSVDVAACGENILSTLPNNSYGYLNGTSVATPYVTATAALIKAANPEANVKDIVNAIKNSAEKKDGLNNKVATAGRANCYIALSSLKGNSNSAPVASNVNGSTTKNQPIQIGLKGEDRDLDPLNFKIVKKPNHGKVVIEGNTLTYTPNRDFVGEDVCEYIATDGKSESNVAAVKIEVKDKVASAPIAKEDSVTTKVGDRVVIDVLVNDRSDSGGLVLDSISTPTCGVAKIVDNKIEYIATKEGVDKIEYRVRDRAGNKATSKVTLNVKNRYSFTKSVAKEDRVRKEGRDTILIDVLKNDELCSDVEIIKVSKPRYGEANIKDNKIEYSCDKNRRDFFYYTIKDATGAISTAKVIVEPF